MKKIHRESGFSIFGGKFYVTSLNLGLGPPFCNCLYQIFEFLLYFGCFGLLELY